MDGCNQIKLLKAVAKVGAENNELSRVTLYEEWDSVDSSLQCGVYRADQELLERGLGFDAGSGKLMALQVHRTACAPHVHRVCTRACAHLAHARHTHTRRTHGVYPRCTPTRLGMCTPTRLGMWQGERAAVEGFSLLAEDYVPGAT